ncbi:MAG: hypothetical protein ABR562_03100, partial [Thermoplasmatota archaeon]
LSAEPAVTPTQLLEARKVIGQIYVAEKVKDYIVDATVDPQARLALRLVLENGTAITPLPGVPVPVGGGQDIVYDFGLAFSLVLVPWYAPDPPVTTTSHTPAHTAPPPTSTGAKPVTTTTTTKGSPSLPVLAVGLAVVAAAIATRRRL